MQDGSFITRVFVILIIVMLAYAGNSYVTHKQNLEKLILDQQDVINKQNLAIKQLQQANMYMYHYISQQQHQPNVIH